MWYIRIRSNENISRKSKNNVLKLDDEKFDIGVSSGVMDLKTNGDC